MANDLSVTLDKSKTPWLVDIDQKNGANQVARSNQSQTITWQLTGDAASGNITGFSWLQQPNAGIFEDPVIATNGNTMTMSDLNNSASTTGDWTYQLTIEVGGQSYQSAATSLTDTSTNPTIKNN